MEEDHGEGKKRRGASGTRSVTFRSYFDWRGGSKSRVEAVRRRAEYERASKLTVIKVMVLGWRERLSLRGWETIRVHSSRLEEQLLLWWDGRKVGENNLDRQLRAGVEAESRPVAG